MNPIFFLTILGFIWVPSSGSGQEQNEKSIIDSIEAQAKELPAESYNKDPYCFSQTIHSSTNATTYHWTKGKVSGPPLFQRNTSDEGKEIIVLRMGEDRLRVARTKRTFVVLIKKQDVTNKTKLYHPLFAYSRGDQIEWDLWEPERLRESKAFVLGWTTCTSSIFTPCKPKIERNSGCGPPAYLEEFQKELVSSSYNSKYDYFLDLEDTHEEMREIGRFASFTMNGKMGGRRMPSKTKQSDRPLSEESPNFEDVFDDAKLEVSSGPDGMSGRGVAAPQDEKFKLLSTKTVAAGNKTLAEVEAEELAKYANETDYEFEIIGEIITVTAYPDDGITLAPKTATESPNFTPGPMDQITPHPGMETTPNPKQSTPDPKSEITSDPKSKTTPNPKSNTTSDPKFNTTLDPKSNTTSDPKSNTKSDPKFNTTPDPKSNTNSDPKSNTTSDPKSNTTPDPKSNTTSDPKSNTTSDPKSNTIPDPKSKITSNPKSNTTSDPKSTTTPDPKSKTTPDPKYNTTSDLKSNTTSDPKSKTTSDPKSQTTPDPKSKTTPDPKSKITPDPKSNTTSDPKSKTTPDPKSKITPDPKSNTTSDPKSKTTPDPKSKITPDPKSNTTSDPKSKTTPDPKSNTTPDPKSNTTPDPKSNTTSDPKSNTTSDPKSNTTSDPKSNTTSDPKSNTTSDPKSNTTPDPKSNTTSDPKSNTTSDPKSNTTSDPKSNTTSDPKSNTTSDPKSQTTPDPNSKTTPDLKSNTTPDPNSTTYSNSKPLDSRNTPTPKSNTIPNPKTQTSLNPTSKPTPDSDQNNITTFASVENTGASSKTSAGIRTDTTVVSGTTDSTTQNPNSQNTSGSGAGPQAESSSSTTLAPKSSITPGPNIKTTIDPKSETTPDPKSMTTPDPKSKIAPDPKANTTPDPKFKTTQKPFASLSDSKTTTSASDATTSTYSETGNPNSATPGSDSATTPDPKSKITPNSTSTTPDPEIKTNTGIDPKSKTTPDPNPKSDPKTQTPSNATANSKSEVYQNTTVASASASPAASETTTIQPLSDKTLYNLSSSPSPKSNVTQKPSVTPPPEPFPTNSSIPTTIMSTTTTSPKIKTKTPKSKPESEDEDEDEDESTEAPKKKKKKKTTVTIQITPQMAGQMYQSVGGNQGSYSGNNVYKGQGAAGSNKPGQTAAVKNQKTGQAKCAGGGGLLGLLGLNLGLGLGVNKGGLGLGLSLGIGCTNLLNLGVGLGANGNNNEGKKSGLGLGVGLALGGNAKYPVQNGRGVSKNKSSELPVKVPKASIEGITKFLDSKLSEVDLFGRHGWKTQDIVTDKLKNFKVMEERDPFIGFGECGHENVTLDRFKGGDDVTELVKSRLTPLRAQCKKELIQVLVNVVKNGGLLTNVTFPNKADHTFFKLLLDWNVVTKPKLTKEEKAQLNIAFEFYWFTQAFLWTLDHKGQPFHTVKDMMKDTFPSPFEESPKSPYVVFRLYTALLMFDEIFAYLPAHAIALSRSLILTMKMTLIKSLQDYFRLKNCAACDPTEAAHLSNDLTSLIAFPEFISNIFSSDATARGPMALVTNFNNFVNDNRQYLENRLLDYTS